MKEASHFQIGIDCRFAAKDVGIGRYIREVAFRLPKLLQDTHFVFFVTDANAEWLRGLQDVELEQVSAKAYSLREQTVFSRRLHTKDLHLLFFPHFNVPAICSVPYVTTIHDLILHRHPNQSSFLKQMIYRQVFSRAVRRARNIIAVSAYTKRTLLDEEKKVPEDRITVIPECAGAQFFARDKNAVAETLHRLALHRPYFLYVGNAKEHKRVPVLFRAFASLPHDAPELVCVMSGKEVKHLNVPPRVRVLSSLSDEDLSALYSGAVSFVSASIDEGFCLPIAEAQACNCPVIAVRAGAILEIAGENAKLIGDTQKELQEAMLRPPAPSPLPLHPRTWDDVAAETASVLRASILAV